MAQLTFTYDTSTRRFTAASIDGRPLPGVKQVVLGVFTVEVMDQRGQDLLAAAGVSSEPTLDPVTQGIAACFGAGPVAPASPAEGDSWFRTRGAR